MAKHSGAHLDLSGFSSVEELMSLGLDRLKSALMALGLKCGGVSIVWGGGGGGLPWGEGVCLGGEGCLPWGEGVCLGGRGFALGGGGLPWGGGGLPWGEGVCLGGGPVGLGRRG